jgi:hypothetical protein
LEEEEREGVEEAEVKTIPALSIERIHRYCHRHNQLSVFAT